MNVCENSITEFDSKDSFKEDNIDSVTMFSNELKKTQLLTERQIKTFTIGIKV